MRLFFIIVLSVISQVFIFGRYMELNDARSISLAGTINATGESCMGISNPAGLVDNTSICIGMHYNNRFMLPELGIQGFTAAVPVWGGSFAGRINYFGSGEFNQTEFVVSYGHDINKWIAAGVDLKYHSESIKALRQKRATINGNLGVILRPMNELRIGMYYVNLSHTAYDFQKEGRAGTSLYVGVTFSETEKFLIAYSMSWMDFRWIDIALGAEVYLNKKWVIRGGISLPSSMTCSFGTGVFLPNMEFSMGFQQHPVLGLSSSVSVIIHFKGNGKR